MSMYIDATSGAVEHCETMANLHPELAEKYQLIASHCRSKLWHQLTLTIQTFVDSSDNLRTTTEGTNSFLALYDKVVLSVDKKINPLSLARIASSVSSSLVSTDGTAAKALLENLLEEKKARLGVPATIYVESRLHLLSLTLFEKQELPPSGSAEMQRIADSIQRNAALLQELAVDTKGSSTSSSVVHSAHYECGMKYRKVVGPPEAFYAEALSYINYTPLDQIDDTRALAVDLSLAALTGDGVFNFGQVVTKPILRVLVGTPDEWLVELMEIMAKGDVLAFTQLTEKHSAAIQAQPTLVHRANVVKEKITLLSLVNMVFERPSAERTLGFQEVADRIQVPLDQVELVVMRALSLNLMEGCLDQVSKEIEVTWVMPRVLTPGQMQELAARFGQWAVKSSKTKDYMDQHTPALFG